MLEHLIDSNNLKEEFKKNGLDEGDLMFIKELIDGPQQETDDESEWPYIGRDADKGFLYEVRKMQPKCNVVTSTYQVSKYSFVSLDCCKQKDRHRC